MPISIGNISLYMGPHTAGAPDNLEEVIVDFIDGAKKSLDVAVQELESEPIARALVKARQRGVKIRIVLEGDYLIADRAVSDPFDMEQMEAHDPNRTLIAALWRAKIDVRTDYNPYIFHQKFIVRDFDGDARLLTGSTNFTPTGTHKNLNHVAIFDHKNVAREYMEEFEEIWSGTFGEKRNRHERHPSQPRVSDVSLRINFAPDHMPEMEIMKQMLKARQRIDFAIFTFAQSSGIDDTMIALSRAGLSVRGIADSAQGNQDWAASRPLHESGVDFYLAKKNSADFGKLHHKLMVIDEQVVIIGSFNYTNPATMVNDENIIVIGDLDETRPEGIENQKKLGAYALDEINRIIDRHGQKLAD